jgi:D-glycerate 3-kinase
LIEVACREVGLRICVLGLDDFYLTKVERQRLADRVHPLLETRGPPGSHDVVACREALIRLGREGAVDWPSFDKGLDDRSGSRSADGPFDVVVLEGWCVGAEASPVASLELPINELERKDDLDGTWRRYVNDQLRRGYRELWATLDELVFLQVPDLLAVRRWRLQQEEALPVGRRLDPAAIDRFVQHYERITLAMIERLPGRADLTIRLGEDHSISSIQRVADSRFV